MRLRNALGVAAGSVGLTAVANRLLSTRAEGLEEFLDGEYGSYRWRGFEIAYAEAGDPENQDLLLFHGINGAASSHEFAAVFEALAAEYHVIAPDLPGFGHSDRPPLLYSASLYTTFVEDAIADLTDEPPVVVASSLTGSYAALAAKQREVAELVLICPSTSSMGPKRRWLRTLLRAPVFGQALFNLIVSKPGLRYFHEDHGYYDSSNRSDAVLDYEWRSAHQRGARFAPASFVSGYLAPEESVADALAGIDTPVTLVWGRESDTPPLSAGRQLADRVDARLVVFDNAMLLPHVEHPDEFRDLLRQDQTVEREQ